MIRGSSAEIVGGRGRNSKRTDLWMWNPGQKAYDCLARVVARCADIRGVIPSAPTPIWHIYGRRENNGAHRGPGTDCRCSPYFGWDVQRPGEAAGRGGFGLV